MENAYIIKGGKKIKGQVTLSGAKNVALKVIIASLMFNQPVILKNIPQIKDIEELFNLIKDLGGKISFIEKNTVKVDGRLINKNKVSLLYGSKIRVSFLFFAPLLNKFHECYIPNPGGCRIGARPIDRIVDGMKKLGIEVSYNSETGYYYAKKLKDLTGEYTFPKPTHTGTELMILLSVLNKKRVVLKNCALEPEIDDLINFLNQSGAKIKRINREIIIDGQLSLKQRQPYSIISDRNEFVTYTSLALATKGEIKIGPISNDLVFCFLDHLKKIGIDYYQPEKDWYFFKYMKPFLASRIETSPHPGFMTDWQPNWAILMTQARGDSVIIERVFENRFAYVDELKKLGAKIDFVNYPINKPEEYFFFNYDPKKNYQQMIKIYGSQKLHSGVLKINDLRAGAALLIAALITEGESVIDNADILERGYEMIIEKIRNLGGEIKKI